MSKLDTAIMRAYAAMQKEVQRLHTAGDAKPMGSPARAEFYNQARGVQIALRVLEDAYADAGKVTK